MLLAIVYAVHGGIHIVARCSEIIGPIVVLNVLLYRLLSIKDLRLDRLLPLMPTAGWMPVLQGTIPTLSFLSESVMIVMLVAFLSEKKKAVSFSLWGVGIAGLIILSTTIDVLLVMDNTVPGKLQNPVYSFSQYISVMDFIQNLDSLLVVGVSFTVFIKAYLYVFMTSYGTAQLFHIRKWRRLLWVVGILVFLIAVFPRNVDVTEMAFPVFWKNVILPFFLFAIPLLLWMIGSVKHRMRRIEQPKAP